MSERRRAIRWEVGRLTGLASVLWVVAAVILAPDWSLLTVLPAVGVAVVVSLAGESPGYRTYGSGWFGIAPVAVFGAVVAGVGVSLFQFDATVRTVFGVVSVLIGLWVLADAVAMARLDAPEGAPGELSARFCRELFDDIVAADGPVPVSALAADRGDESRVRGGLYLLRLRGLAERRADGYVATPIVLGHALSLRGVSRRLLRPWRVLTGVSQ